MARHNREGSGSDQRGYDYTISYQPDWLHWIKITRTLESGRQSTKTLFQNPGRKERAPGENVRTRIVSEEQGLDFEIAVDDPDQVIKRVVVETQRPGVPEDQGKVMFTIQEELPPPNGE